MATTDGPGPSTAIETGICIDTRIDAPVWKAAVADPEAVCHTAAEAAFLACSPGRRRIEAGVLLTDDQAVRRLNRDYRGKDRPTNVLAFAQWNGNSCSTPPDHAPLLLGDVVVAFETASAEAAAAGIPLASHLCHLIVHGMFHLMGLDHETVVEATRMELLETEVLAGFGIADPHAETAGGRASDMTEGDERTTTK